MNVASGLAGLLSDLGIDARTVGSHKNWLAQFAQFAISGNRAAFCELCEYCEGVRRLEGEQWLLKDSSCTLVTQLSEASPRWTLRPGCPVESATRE